MADFWRHFDSFSTGAGLLADWRAAFREDYERLRPLLTPTERHGRSYPCPFVPWCGCRHEMRDTGSGLVAVCVCGPGECEPFDVEPKDIVIYSLDRARLAEAARSALGFAPADTPPTPSPSPAAKIGLWAPLQTPVYLCFPAGHDALLRETERLVGRQAGPFILLTPTRGFVTAETEAALERAACLWLPLSLALEVEPGGGFRAMQPLEPLLANWSARLAKSNGNGAILQSIHREIAAVRDSFIELRTAKERLEKMLADGLFAFTRKVDAQSFKIFCAILAEGDAAKAGRILGVPPSSLWDQIQTWRRRGDAFKTMFDLVRWRKKVGRKETVSLNENILLEKANAADYPALLSDVLDGLLSMTDENWRQQCDEMVEVLRPAVR